MIPFIIIFVLVHFHYKWKILSFTFFIVLGEVTSEVAEVDGGESGAYYIDQATGQYYYESRSEDGQRVMTVVPGRIYFTIILYGITF